MTSPPIIPVDWLREANVLNFRAQRTAYRAGAFNKAPEMAIAWIAVAEIALPVRTRDSGPFDHERMLNILNGLRRDVPIEPIVVDTPPPDYPFPFRLIDGFHRVCACLALGFSHVPAVVYHFNRDVPLPIIDKGGA